jgi:hypothetical protein
MLQVNAPELSRAETAISTDEHLFGFGEIRREIIAQAGTIYNDHLREKKEPDATGARLIGIRNIPAPRRGS